MNTIILAHEYYSTVQSPVAIAISDVRNSTWKQKPRLSMLSVGVGKMADSNDTKHMVFRRTKEKLGVAQ